MNDGLSRQRRWQLRMKAKGLCVQCGRILGQSVDRCDECLVKQRVLHRKRMGFKPQCDTGRGRPPYVSELETLKGGDAM